MDEQSSLRLCFVPFCFFTLFFFWDGIRRHGADVDHFPVSRVSKVTKEDVCRKTELSRKVYCGTKSGLMTHNITGSFDFRLFV